MEMYTIKTRKQKQRQKQVITAAFKMFSNLKFKLAFLSVSYIHKTERQKCFFLTFERSATTNKNRTMQFKVSANV